jgi:hypothetical protein
MTRLRPCATCAVRPFPVVSAWDDDDWTGEPPEGRHPASRADPGFWRDHVPLSITGVGLGIALIILLIVWLL